MLATTRKGLAKRFADENYVYPDEKEIAINSYIAGYNQALEEGLRALEDQLSLYNEEGWSFRNTWINNTKDKYLFCINGEHLFDFHIIYADSKRDAFEQINKLYENTPNTVTIELLSE